MLVTENNTVSGWRLAASVSVPAPPERLYRTVLDVSGFPSWAPGVRRVEVLERPGEPGMVSEWELSALGLRKRVLSVLDEAEPPGLLRWSYMGPVNGWGECRVRAGAGGAVATFVTELRARDPRLDRFLRSAPVRHFARSSLRTALARLGATVSGGTGGVRVGPPVTAG